MAKLARAICWVRLVAIALVACALLAAPARAQNERPGPALAYLDGEGVVRWRANDEEVRLFGANYCAFSGSDYRVAGRLGYERRTMIEEDMAQFARMGWDGLRLCSWGDWENADATGNLIANEHLDLMDYLIAQARERGIYILLTPIHTYNPGWPDQMERSNALDGFSRHYERGILGTDQRAIAAQVNYIRQLLEHVNSYTGVALKDDPNILFVEMINEPVHHPEDHAGSIAYIDALVGAVRASGSQQITFHNYTQDFRIGAAIHDSSVQGVSMGWYPSGLVAGRTLRGNFLQAVDSYPAMLAPEVSGRARIVYEFDQADLLTATMYPAMARTYRSVGAQFAAVFAYDMLRSAPYNLGWQTHFINLVHTPRKAMGGVLAAEAMRRLPRMQDYGRYPESLSYGDFRLNYEDDTAVLAARDAYINAGETEIAAPSPRTLTRIAGLGSSPLVTYEGEGAYFIDKISDGVWRLEVYPDSLHVEEPFAQPQPGRVVSRLYFHEWPMRIALPNLGRSFTALPLNIPNQPSASRQRAQNGVFNVRPGVWILSRRAEVDISRLPETVNRVGLREFHINANESYPNIVLSLAPGEFVAGADAPLRVRVASEAPPDEVTLRLRPAGQGWYGEPLAMQRERAYDFAAVLPANLAPGLYEYIVTIRTGVMETTFPGALSGRPGVWPFAMRGAWRFTVAAPDAPLTIFDPGRDFSLLSFVRPQEQFRTPFFRIAAGETSERQALYLAVPDLGAHTPEHYAGALYIGDAIAARGDAQARGLNVRLRASGGARKTLELYLIERDGSSWRAALPASADWSTQHVALDQLSFSRSIHIPSPFPGLWNYWREGPAARASGRIAPENIERLELRVRRNAGETASDDAPGVEIASVWLDY